MPSSFKVCSRTLRVERFTTSSTLTVLPLGVTTSKDALESIGEEAFYSSHLLSVSLPNVETIARQAFVTSKLTSLSLPKAKTIGSHVFSDSNIGTLSLPEAITIGTHAFDSSRLEELKIPKATSIGTNAFANIVNLASTHVTMNQKFNTPAEKDRIFGTGK